MAVALFSILSLLLPVMIHSKSNVCLWGYVADTTTIIGSNGLYEEQGSYGGAPFYNRTITSSCQSSSLSWYIYYYNVSNQWWVSQFPPSEAISYHEGIGTGVYRWLFCNASSNTVPSCVNEWTSNYYPPLGQSPIITQNDTCPEWDCNGIRITDSDVDNCNGIFTPTPIPYKYEEIQYYYDTPDDNPWIIYFNDASFFWVCTREEYYRSQAGGNYGCGYSYWGITDDELGWFDLQENESFQPQLSSSTSNELGNIYCLATLEPTIIPIYDYNYDAFPTFIPTMEPIPQPTEHPTEPTVPTVGYLFPTSDPSMEATLVEPTSSPIDLSTNSVSINKPLCFVLIILNFINILCFI